MVFPSLGGHSEGGHPSSVADRDSHVRGGGRLAAGIPGRRSCCSRASRRASQVQPAGASSAVPASVTRLSESTGRAPRSIPGFSVAAAAPTMWTIRFTDGSFFCAQNRYQRSTKPRPSRAPPRSPALLQPGTKRDQRLPLVGGPLVPTFRSGLSALPGKAQGAITCYLRTRYRFAIFLL